MTSRVSHAPARKFTGNALFAETDNDWLVLFRIVFGGVMVYWVARQALTGAIDAYFISPRLHFHYFGFAWVNPFAAPGTRIEFTLMGLAAVMITVGAAYRVASLLFALGFWHLFLADKCLYQNHYYLVCLVAGMMVILPANRVLSVDAWLFPQRRSDTVAVWTLWLVRFQIGLPYFFGGVAKLSPDWIAGEPMRSMLAERTSYPLLGPLFTQDWCVQFFVWGGLLFDLLVVPALLWPRTRVLAFVVACCFHLLNATLFTIGIFPWFMILATAVYFRPGCWRRRLFGRRGLADPLPLDASRGPSAIFRKGITIALAIYALVQIILPLRHYVMPGNPNWTEEGHYFAWHMLLRGKKPALRFIATDPASGKTGWVDLRDYVTAFQLNRVARDPRMIHELAQYIAADFDDRYPHVEVRAFSLVSLNGRKPQLMIDPRVNLATESAPWGTPRWIVPLSEPLRRPPWDVPVLQWEQLVEIPERFRTVPNALKGDNE